MVALFIWDSIPVRQVIKRRLAIKRYTPRKNSGGNFCGHLPSAPSFRDFSPRYAGTHPLLRKAIELLERYYSKPNLLEQLSRIRTNGDRRGLTRDGTPRQVRSEQRDINIKVLSYCLSKLNLFKLQVGVVPYHDFENLYSPTIEQIARDLGESLIRVQRAFAHWKHAGYISITPRRRKNPDGQWESISPIIVIRKHLLILLGISEAWLTSAQKYVYDRWKRERQQRFQRAVSKETELATARNKAEHDFFTQELLHRVEGWRDLSRTVRSTHPPNPPPGAMPDPSDAN